MFGNIGSTEILIILFIVLLLFGAKKLPELAQALGKGIREFKRSVHEIEEEVKVEPKKGQAPEGERKA